MHQCSQCDKSYQRSEHLTRHVQTAHPSGSSARPYVCNYPGCGRTFNRNDVLRRHMGIHPGACPPPSKKQRTVKSEQESPTVPLDSKTSVPLSDSPHPSTSTQGPTPDGQSPFSPSASLQQQYRRQQESQSQQQAQPQPQQQQPRPPHQHPHQHHQPSTRLPLLQQQAYPNITTNRERGREPSWSSQSMLSPHALYSDYRPGSIGSSPRADEQAQRRSHQRVASIQSQSPSAFLSPSHLSPSSYSGVDQSPNGQPSQSVESRPEFRQDTVISPQYGLADGQSETSPSVHATATSTAYNAPNLASNLASTHGKIADPSNVYSGFNQATSFQQVPAQTSVDTFDRLLFDNTQGPRAGALQEPDVDLSGLDWMFSALDHQIFPTWNEPPVPVAESIEQSDPPSVISVPDSTVPLESIERTGLSTEATVERNKGEHDVDQVKGSGTAPKKTTAKVMSIKHLLEDGGEWPHDYRPTASKPAPIELTQFKLRASSRSRASSPHSPSESFGPEVSPGITISDETRQPHLRSDHVPAYCKVDEATRVQLLDYIRRSCDHPWSRYKLSSRTEGFLTQSELQLLAKLFFDKFHPHLPFLHKTTFTPSRVPSVLLLVVITLGLVFYPASISMSASGQGTPAFQTSVLNSRRLAIALSELARVGIVSAVESDSKGFMQIFVTQSWLLQQTFGIGGGDKRLYQLAERNRTGIITFVRRLGLLRANHEALGTSDPASQPAKRKNQTLEERWQSWIEKESRVRLGWSVFLFDQSYAAMLDLPPVLIYSEVTSCLPCDEPLWNAASAEEWATIHDQKESADSDAGSINYLSVLQSLLTGSQLPIKLNRFGALVIATTMYRLMWDHSKQSLLIGWSTEVEHNPQALGLKARRVLYDLVDAVLNVSSVNSSGRIHRASSLIPLSYDLELVQILADLHFNGPPLFTEKLKDAAGRFGFGSRSHQEAHHWLQNFVSAPQNQISIRKMMFTAASVFEVFVGTRAEDDVSRKSLGYVIAIFDSALILWASVKYRYNLRASQSRGHARHEGLHPLRLTREKDAIYDDWIKALDISSSGSVELPPLYVEGIGVIFEGTFQNANAVSLSVLLERFVKLMEGLDWGLAGSFRAVLQRLASLEGSDRKR